MSGDEAANEDPDPEIDLTSLLGAAEAAAPVDAVEAVAAELREMVGAAEVSFLIADFSGDALIRLGHSDGGGDATRRTGRETAERVALEGTPQGRALTGQRVELAEDADGTWLFAPVTSRGEAVGVLELKVATAPDAEVLAHAGAAAHALAYIVIASRRYTDLFEWGQRSVPLSLAAEIQHRLLPGSYTCEAAQFTLAGWLEPAGEVGGDTFDFSLGRDELFFSITDAMGHTVNASLLATLLVGSLRNGRRRGAGLGEQARLADAALNEHAGHAEFVTGQIACIDLAAGTAQIVNAGHPLPLRLRDGVVDELPLAADPPFGALSDSRYTVQTLPLRAGDRLMFVTDGLLERRATRVDLKAVLAAGGEDHPREAVRRLIATAVEASGGTLPDDATALCLDWHGGPPRERDASEGADRAR